jgi:hypothetical protein
MMQSIRLKIGSIALLLATGVAAPCAAQTMAAESIGTDPGPDAVPSNTGSVRLTPEQREAALEEGAARAAAGLQPGDPADRRIHGEMGVEVGTGGERAAYGMAVIPLGENGAAAVAFETDRVKYRRHRR